MSGSAAPLGQPVTPVEAVRGSLICGSLQTLRERGHYERYLALLPDRSREPVLYALAGGWIDVKHALAHYGAAEGLHLPNEELLEIGRSVGTRIQSTFLGTLGRRARDVGAAPWLFLHHADRVWTRMMNGGRVTVRELGPKDAVLKMEGIPLARFGYFRHGFEGVILAGASLLSRKCYTKILPERSSDDELAVLVRWV